MFLNCDGLSFCFAILFIVFSCFNECLWPEFLLPVPPCPQMPSVSISATHRSSPCPHSPPPKGCHLVFLCSDLMWFWTGHRSWASSEELWPSPPDGFCSWALGVLRCLHQWPENWMEALIMFSPTDTRGVFYSINFSFFRNSSRQKCLC